MKIVKILVFFLLLFVLDAAIGTTLRYLYSNSKSYSIVRLQKAVSGAKEDVLILGSSRAYHHYVSTIVSDSLHVSVYNCGFESQGNRFAFIILKSALSRYSPKQVVVDLSPSINQDQYFDDHLSTLIPFCENRAVYQELTRDNFKLKFALVSSIYPFNSQLIDIAAGNLNQWLGYPYYTDTLSGYFPLKGELKNVPNSGNKSPDMKELRRKFAASKDIGYLDSISNICIQRNVNLTFVVSPICKPGKEQLEIVRLLKTKVAKDEKSHRKIGFYDYSTFDSDSVSLFYDSFHLNENGAANFTCKLVHDGVFN